jgi:hypothetical protein
MLGPPEVSADGRTWTYRNEPGLTMDSSYNQRVPAATEMLAVFAETAGDRPVPVPEIRVTGTGLGTWKRMDVEIEWGFLDGDSQVGLSPRIESSVAFAGSPTPLDPGTDRQGMVLPLLYAPDARPGLDSRITVWTAPDDGFTFRIRDLEAGPILVPAHGMFVSSAGTGQNAKQFVAELQAQGLESVRTMTRRHREAESWEELMREVRIWTCPEGTELKPFPDVPDPAMEVDLPDPGWTAAWRAATNQLRGGHMWGGLAFEVARVAHTMELIGLHGEADKVYQHFLASPGVKPDGDYTDGSGALEWAKDLRHDMGYNHDGTHASTGRLLFAMCERLFLTGDREWFEQNRLRLQAAADWILRQRKLYMQNLPGRENLFVAGLMPPCMLGDYAMPACDWHWYYVDNALALQGVQRFADAMMTFDPGTGEQYQAEAEAFRRDLRRAVNLDAVLAPVRRGRDGMYHSYIPRMAYARGLTGPELGAPQFPDTDVWMGALPLAEPFAVLEAGDRRVVDTLDLMEEMGTSAEAVRQREEARQQKGLPTEDAWFWHPYSILPKASHTANIFLLQDDVPNFLRFLLNAYASMVGADGRLWEHWHLGQYGDCEAPDNGTAGWFMGNFRNLLVMEDGGWLWLARATPRAWLKQGGRIAVRNAPTYFGALAYEITSDVENGRITATVEVPERRPLQGVRLRLRHPRGLPMRRVTVNGLAWTGFNPETETIDLTDASGTAVIVAEYDDPTP